MVEEKKQFLPFPKDFLFGTAVSSFQVEGNSGDRKSDWDIFLADHPDIISPGQVGPQWWVKGKAEADIDMLSQLHMQSQRLSFEWARIEPEEGKINLEAIKRYRDITTYLQKKNITPMVTLNHYSLPQWVAKKGGWQSNDIVVAFERYTKCIAREFSDVKKWITINEPGVLIESGYLLSFFPPQAGSPWAAFIARRHMIAAHKKAYAVLKKEIPSAQISMAFSFRWYRPANPKDLLESLYASCINYFDSLNYVDAVKNYIDFIGCNFYAGYYLNLNLSKIHFWLHGPASHAPKTILFGEVRKEGAYVSDLGAPIVPGFFLELLQTLTRRYKKPIIITENGIADHRDYHRAFYLLTHLISVWRAIQQGADIREYLVWSSVDNLEWLEGYKQEFGLIHVDPISGKRDIRKSAHMYKEIIDARGIDVQHLLSRYLKAEQRGKAATLIRHLFLKHKATLSEYISLDYMQEVLQKKKTDFFKKE